MENTEHPHTEHQLKPNTMGQKQIAGAILLAGVLIAGSIWLKGSVPGRALTGTPGNQVAQQLDNTNPSNVVLDPVTPTDRTVGNAGAPVTFVEYADFQCPYCGIFHKQTEPTIISDYVNKGKVRFVYRDYPFLGPESTRAAEAALCANEQGKFWEYHDYLFSHQNGENKGTFNDDNLESFAKTLGLDTATFNSCFASGKYENYLTDSVTKANRAGVTGTPKGFIVKNGKIVDTMDGAEPLGTVTAKLNAALK